MRILQRTLRELCSREAFEEMHADVFGAFSFGAPEDGSFQAVNAFGRNAMDAEFEFERITRFETGMQRQQPQAYGRLGPARSALAAG